MVSFVFCIRRAYLAVVPRLPHDDQRVGGEEGFFCLFPFLYTIPLRCMYTDEYVGMNCTVDCFHLSLNWRRMNEEELISGKLGLGSTRRPLWTHNMNVGNASGLF
jgi:hypothetical protein